MAAKIVPTTKKKSLSADDRRTIKQLTRILTEAEPGFARAVSRTIQTEYEFVFDPETYVRRAARLPKELSKTS